MFVELDEKEIETITDALRASALVADRCASHVGRSDAYTEIQAFSIIKAQGCRARRYRRLAAKVENAHEGPVMVARLASADEQAAVRYTEEINGEP